MYVEKDKEGNIIIQALTPEDAELLTWCICSYFSKKAVTPRTPEEKKIIQLKKELEKDY